MLRLLRTSTLLAAVAVLAACTDEGSESELPTAPEAPPAFSDAKGEGHPPGLVRNGVPYRNPDYQHATGRSGEASLTARALMNKDGSTDFEVTSGTLTGDAAHEITKLQIKYATPNDEPVWVRNENQLRTGVASYVFEDLARHGSLQAQGNVTGSNASGKRSRTGVVTITERVNLRPDLAVTQLSGPGRAYMNTTVAFSASISELNGDLSASANCVFYINGEEAARSEGLWVGEGDMVGCLMNAPFSEPGTYTITAVVEEVNPGDYDLANNSDSTTIEIVEYQLSGSAKASEDHQRYYYSDFWQTYDNRRHAVHASFYGFAPRAVRFPASLNVTQSSGGTVRHQVSLSDFGTSGSGQLTCNNHWDAGNTTQVCSDAERDLMWVNVSRNTGMATYYTRWRHRHWWSSRHCHGWNIFGWCTGGYHTHWHYYYHDHHSNSRSQWGDGFAALGGDYAFDVRLADDEGTIFKSDSVIVDLSPETSYGFQLGYTSYWGRRNSVEFGDGS
jgi:hypothetical protein